MTTGAEGHLEPDHREGSKQATVSKLPQQWHLLPNPQLAFGHLLLDTAQIFASVKLEIKSKHPPNQSYG